MAVDSTALAADPEGQASAAPAPSSPPADPAAPSRSDLGSLRDAFRADPDGAALKAGPSSAERGTPPQGDTPSESSAADAGSAASKPDGERVRQPDSRRGAAQALAERTDEVERLVAERQAEQQRADQAAAALEKVTRQQQEAQQSVLERIGDDAEFEQLQDARLRNRPLSFEQDQKLDAMLAARTEAATYWTLADRAHKAHIARGLAGVVDRFGLDRETAFGADLTGLVEHAVAVTEARVKAESAERIASLEAEVKGLRPRAAAARVTPPTGGGASGTPGDRMPADGASPLEWFRAGARADQERVAVRTARR